MVQLANFDLGKELIIKSTTFPHKDIYKYRYLDITGWKAQEPD